MPFVHLFNAVTIGGVLKDVALATAAALPACTPAGAGAGHTLTANAVGVLTVDGVAPTLNQRILVKNQVAADDNGLYQLSTVGTGGVAWVLTRVTDFDTLATGEIEAGARVLVAAGTANAGTTWYLSTVPAVVDTNNLAFTADTNEDNEIRKSSALSVLLQPNIDLDIVITETHAPLTGTLKIERAIGDVKELDRERSTGTDVLPWRHYPRIAAVGGSGPIISSGAIVIAGATSFTMSVKPGGGWGRLRWDGTLGVGTLDVRACVR